MLHKPRAQSPAVEGSAFPVTHQCALGCLTFLHDCALQASSINPLVSGNIAVVRRGTCTFTLKAANLAAAGT